MPGLLGDRGREITLADRVYERLRHAIVRGELRPNQRLVEADLAASLHVSRTPIREVLQRLEADGLVVSARRSWVVREHTADEIRQIFECRIALEGQAARLAAMRVDSARAEAIAAAAEEVGRVIQDRARRVEANDRFHDLVIEAAGNPMLMALIERSRLYHFNRRLAALYTEEELARSQDQHLRLVRALRDHDPEAAERVTHEHLETSLQTALAKLAPEP
ncbi:MAG TPA: GntR family transcriptional regulator [Candidatus Dormibacteraeota bacterium]|nr:GntR family transcriptional regulator [Candidatus Dormibacteraeota bacterium]